MRNAIAMTMGAALGLLLGCATMDKDATPHVPNATQIGLVLPVTGGGGQLTQHQEYAVRMAISEINAAGGVNGKPLDVLLRDDKASATFGVQAARELAGMEIPVLIGSAYSGITRAILSEVTDALYLPVISPSATSPTLTGFTANKTFFRTAPSDAFQGVVLASEVYSQGVKDIAIIHVGGAYGEGLANSFTAKFTALGGSIRQRVSYTDKIIGFSTEVASLFSKGVPQGVLMIGYIVDGANITRDIQQYNPQPRPKMFGGESLYDAAFLANGDATILEGMMGTVNQPPVASPGFMTFSAKFKAATKEDPYIFSESAYDAVYMAALAMQKGKANTRQVVLANLRAVSNPSATPAQDVPVLGGEWSKALTTLAAGGHVAFQGASGRIGWDANGDVTSGTYSIYKVVRSGGGLAFETVKTITYPSN